MGTLVDTYLVALDSNDWPGLASTLASDFERPSRSSTGAEPGWLPTRSRRRWWWAALPRNASGKVLKTVLRERYGQPAG